MSKVQGPSSKFQGQVPISNTVSRLPEDLSMEKFPQRVKELIACGVSNDEHMEILVHEIIARVEAQHHPMEMWAILCKRLLEARPESDGEERLRA